MISRRKQLLASNAAGLGALLPAGLARAADTAVLPFENGERPLVTYPGKRPLLRLTARPPQLETPLSVFDGDELTPNDAFFVRYHLAGSPPRIDPEAWRLSIGGAVDRPLSYSLQQLKSAFKPIEYTAVLQCSGNGRGFSMPRVAGGQAGNGLMGNARWTGVPLRALLEQAGVKPSATQVSFNGADRPPHPGIPDFVKTLQLDHAADGEVMLAYAMNGEGLPLLNGYPLRLIVPGWYGTYWIKHLTDIVVLDRPAEAFWMDKAYRVPASEPAGATVPISRMNVRSFVTSHADGASAKRGKTRLAGSAFDGGAGIRSVEVSTDGGQTWRPARLGPDKGRYAFRGWSAVVELPPGEHAIRVRAENNLGAGQPMAAVWNPSGYMRNVVETLRLRVV